MGSATLANERSPAPGLACDKSLVLSLQYWPKSRPALPRFYPWPTLFCSYVAACTCLVSLFKSCVGVCIASDACSCPVALLAAVCVCRPEVKPNAEWQAKEEATARTSESRAPWCGGAKAAFGVGNDLPTHRLPTSVLPVFVVAFLLFRALWPDVADCSTDCGAQPLCNNYTGSVAAESCAVWVAGCVARSLEDVGESSQLGQVRRRCFVSRCGFHVVSDPKPSTRKYYGCETRTPARLPRRCVSRGTNSGHAGSNFTSLFQGLAWDCFALWVLGVYGFDSHVRAQHSRLRVF